MRPTRRRAVRRRRSAPRSYSIAHLLSKQPKGVRKIEHFDTMMRIFMASERLQRIRVNSRCYSLLNNARIAQENLHHFYRTYRLPADPFFPLFFSIKRAYLAARERSREQRRLAILAAMRALAPDVLGRIKYLGYLERAYNAAGRSPVWQTRLFPTSRKKAESYAKYSSLEWLQLYQSHTALLSQRYPALKEITIVRVLACFVLDLTPERIPPVIPARGEIARAYRKLSLRHHPDRGGDPRMFIELRRARDTLLGESGR